MADTVPLAADTALDELSDRLDASGDFAGLIASVTPLVADFPDRRRLCGYLGWFADRAAVAGAADAAVALAALAVEVLEELGTDRVRLGMALATLGRLEYERDAPDLEPLERAADLCDDMDEPVVAATVYAHLGATLAALGRPKDALAAISWSLAEQERVLIARPDLRPALLPLRAEADRVRGLVLRELGRGREAMDYLARAIESATPHTPAQRVRLAEAAAAVVDDLLAEGRPEEATPYAEAAIEALAPPECPLREPEDQEDPDDPAPDEPVAARVALARQRLVRCHLMRGELEAANPLIEELITLARRRPDEPTFRAVLADSLAQSAELLPLLGLDDGPRAESRARESIAIYDELLAAGVDAEGVHTGRSAAGLALACALELRGAYAEAVEPLREAVSTLERFAPRNRALNSYLARALLMLGDALVEADQAMEATLVLRRATQVESELLTRKPR
ncbi:hypothetical protein [Nonomuraea sediminis]|uniref:hypothetical protein n=1 Tax=Nonomuraea sediminis TaxID=2835864 RepID=UPI001BDCDAEB|nr:hypothetical protein [Nonomuraea sediminis]